MKEKMRICYDEEGDFLEIAVGKPTKCYAIELEPGVFVRKDEKTNEVKSVGVLGFKKRSKNLQDIEFNLPVKISMSTA